MRKIKATTILKAGMGTGRNWGLLALSIMAVVGLTLWQPEWFEPVWEESQPRNQTPSESIDASVISGKVLADSNALYPIKRVVDGDTARVVIEGQEVTLRMIGIDTPEVVDPRKPVQCFGLEASNKAKELLTDRRVRLEVDQSQGLRDSFGRLLAYVFLEDGRMFNKMMIEEGFAFEYTYASPYRYQTDFIEAQRLARQEKRGLWGAGCDD